jgi:hypothetical protein
MQQQLDIFDDGRDVMLVNALAEAVGRDDLPAAHAASAALQREFPDDRHLAPAAVLCAAIAAESASTAFADGAALMAARQHLDETLTAAAVMLLGRDAAVPWLAARWRALAQRASGLPFAHVVDAHAAPLWLRAGEWVAAAQAVLGIESWQRKPSPLAWMAQSRFHTHGCDAAWPLLAELAWIAPRLLPGLLARLPDPRLHKLAERFAADFDDHAWPWWPAWLLIEQPLLTTPLAGARADGDSAPERGFKLMQSLLRLERAGRHRDVVQARRTLQGLNAALFAAYMSTR